MTFRTRSGRTLTTNTPILVEALDLLESAWPAAIQVGALLERARAMGHAEGFEGPDGAERFGSALLQMWLKNAVVLMTRPFGVASSVPERPAVHRLNRVQAERGMPVTNLLHQTVELPDSVRAFVALLDGSRDTDELAPSWEAAVNADPAGSTWGKGAPPPVGELLARLARMGLVQAGGERPTG